MKMAQGMRDAEEHAMATVERFEYPPIPDSPSPAWEGVGCAFSNSNEDPVSSPHSTAGRCADGIPAPGSVASPHEAEHSAFENGRKLGMQEGRLLEREAQRDARAAADRQLFKQAVALAEKFARERHAYSLRVEPEVVKLALAIAERILRREVQLDPLMLTGAVRVALGQLSNAARVRLRVPSADLALWLEAMAHVPNLAVRPEVQGVEGMSPGDCIVEAEVGSVDLGIRSQLDGIEQSFFDRAMATAPGTLAEELQGDCHGENS